MLIASESKTGEEGGRAIVKERFVSKVVIGTKATPRHQSLREDYRNVCVGVG